jgi:hypothetical protein
MTGVNSRNTVNIGRFRPECYQTFGAFPGVSCA